MTNEISLLALSVSSNIPHNCDYECNGCPFRGMIQEIENHRISCPYREPEDLGDSDDNDNGDENDDNNGSDSERRRLIPRCKQIGNFLVFKCKKNYEN